MSQYYPDQSRTPQQDPRPLNRGGSVRTARERAEADLRQGSSQAMDSNWAIPQSSRQDLPTTGPKPIRNIGNLSRSPEATQHPAAMRPMNPTSARGSPASPFQEDVHRIQSRDTSRGVMQTDFRFPQTPSHTAASPQRVRGLPVSRLQQQPVNGPISATWPLPKQDPSPPSPWTKSLNEDNKAKGLNIVTPYDSESVYSVESSARAPLAETGVIRQASMGKKAKPALTTIRSPDGDPNDRTLQRASTIDALSAAISAGMGSRSTPKPTRPKTPPQMRQSPNFRMPFDESPPMSPISAISKLEPPRALGTGSTLASPDSSTSSKSFNPLIGPGKGHKIGMSDKIPTERRPPRLDMNAIYETEARGSTTSLTDLIRRATKLASNLDRGKTASRLGMLDMFNAGEKGGNRGSGSISDMLSAFPEPGMTPTSTNQNAPWKAEYTPSGLKEAQFAPRDSQSLEQESSKGRRYCGMSLVSFLVVLGVLIILVAAAVLVPIFLIVVPRIQNAASTSLGRCSTYHGCQNMGISVVSNNQCGCVCVDGFTGANCNASLDPECTTADIAGYNAATAGSSIPPLLLGSEGNFSIPLNATALLALFSANNLSCIIENSLVGFNNIQTQKEKRFYPFPDAQDSPETDFGLGAFTAIGVRPHIPAPTEQPKIHALEVRNPQASTVASSNGIVFQASTTAAASTATPAAAAATSSTQNPASSSPSSSSTPSAVSPKTLQFAQTVVLYVFERSSSKDVAANAQLTMQKYLQEVGGAANGTLQIGSAGLDISADFANFEVLLGNGTFIGGSTG